MLQSERMPIRAARLARRLEGELDGPDVAVDRLASTGPGAAGAVVIAFDSDAARAAASSEPAVIVVPFGLARDPDYQGALIRVQEPRIALAQLTRIFDTRPLPPAGVHPTASLAADAQLGDDVKIAAGAVIGSGATLGRGTIVGAGTVVGENASIGENCRLHSRVTVLDGTTIGDRVIIHSGAVIGSDGFGYAPSPSGASKIHHLGRVVIADDVEIGANSTIDRGTVGDTVIGARTKIDNLCQVAHNVSIGEDCLIAAQCGIAGSTVVGRGVTMGGSVGIADHLTIGDGATLGGGSGVTKSVPAGETWFGYPARPYRRFVRESYLLSRLERIWAFVRAGEKAQRQEAQQDA